MAEKYCAYCRVFRPDEGFRSVRHPESGTQRSMCPRCQDTRKKPRTVLQKLADQEREARRKSKK